MATPSESEPAHYTQTCSQIRCQSTVYSKFKSPARSAFTCVAFENSNTVQYMYS